ncbi:Nif11-like leader peptide family natural product precursor [Dapis sp. BLCC M126]|uniref:Nif11-like leader peptide family natural product precursor n=1 Tax=Dapis sp. BLCC M126 TaxID=3400189 RepID=UPI003CE67001
MSLENVRAFYERINDDKEFLAQLQAIEAQEEGKKILKESGYDFTARELEEYTSQMLESSSGEDSVLEDLDEEQIETVFGGLTRFIQPIYGAPTPWWPIKWLLM